MSLLEDIEAASSPPGYPCSVGTILSSLDPAERAQLIEALDRRKGEGWHYSAKAIATALGRRGITVQGPTLQRHRNNLCRCAR